MADTKKFAEVIQVIQAIVTICAIFVGGYWTYLLYVQQRQAYPRLKIEHAVTHIPLPDERVLLVVDIIHANLGYVKLSLPSTDVRIYALASPAPNPTDAPQVDPASPERVSDIWQPIDGRRQSWGRDELVVEPGETDRLHYEFVFSEDIGPLLIYSYFENPTVKDRHIGWTYTSVYDLRSNRGGSEPQIKGASQQVR